MGKTFKEFDVKRHKEQARESTKEADLRTRVKPVIKKEKGGANTWRHLIEFEDEDYYEGE